MNGIHLVIRLPYNRPSEDLPDPPTIEWTAEKENLLWDVIARSRTPESGGTDWTGLSEHLGVPLPYLLYRAQMRYEEYLRSLQDINKAHVGNSNTNAIREEGRGEDRPRSALMQRILTPRAIGTRPLPSTNPPAQQGIPQLSRGRLVSPAKSQSPGPTPKAPRSHPSASGSGTRSTLTMSHKPAFPSPLSPRRQHSVSSSSSSPSSSDVETEEQQRQEEREAVGRRLKELEKMMSNDNLGFARPKAVDGFIEKKKTRVEPKRGRDSTSESTSAGSIPSIPSPGSESSHSLSPNRPLAHSRQPEGNTRSPPRPPASIAIRHGSVPRTRPRPSDKSSNTGSNASSFSDLSDASVTASALEDALMSNSTFRSGGSRLSMFARSHFGRTPGTPHI